MKRRCVPLACFGFLACSTAWANAGTGLMVFGAVHLMVGNTIIGLLEGLALALVFRLSIWKTVLLMIPANYFSAWVGFLALQKFAIPLPLDLDNAMMAIYILIGVTFLASLVLEFPFVAVAFWKKERWLSRSAYGFFAVQTVSYLLLFWFYSQVSWTSIVTDVERVEAAALGLPKEVAIYYISWEDGDVYKMSFTDLQAHKAFELDSDKSDDSLAIRPASTEQGMYQLAVSLPRKDSGEDEMRFLPPMFAADAAPKCPRAPTEYYDPWSVRWHVQRLGSANDSAYTFEGDIWAGDGLRIQKGSEFLRKLAMETPFAVWRVQNIVHLPTDKALFQLSDDMICAYDMETNRLALLARGYGPTAVMEPAGQEGGAGT